jgi:o-succinylbenzoate synthase
VQITGAALHAYRLPLRAAWTSAAGGFTVREGWLLRLSRADGHCGYGDCAPLPMSGTETPERAAAALQAYADQLIGRPTADALATLDAAAGSRTPAARCAVETALLDLLAQDAGRPLTDYLRGGTGARTVAVNAALGGLLSCDAPALTTARADGFDVVKLKVGSAPLAAEIAQLRAIAAQLPTGMRLRLDANRAWDAAQAEIFLAACADLPIEMFEEPLADPQPDTLRRLQARCAFPLALDESLATFDPALLFAAPPVRRLVLKPPRIGGLLPALALARRAAAAGLACVVTSSVDSACGVLAAAHLAAALDNGLAHGLATSVWLAADTGQTPRVAGGRLQLPDATGLGFVPGPELVFS